MVTGFSTKWFQFNEMNDGGLSCYLAASAEYLLREKIETFAVGNHGIWYVLICDSWIDF